MHCSSSPSPCSMGWQLQPASQFHCVAHAGDGTAAAAAETTAESSIWATAQATSAPAPAWGHRTWFSPDSATPLELSAHCSAWPLERGGQWHSTLWMLALAYPLEKQHNLVCRQHPTQVMQSSSNNPGRRGENGCQALPSWMLCAMHGTHLKRQQHCFKTCRAWLSITTACLPDL